MGFSEASKTTSGEACTFYIARTGWKIRPF
jgi:hypothetical protein